MTLDEVTRGYVLSTLDAFGGNKSKAARALGIHRRKLYRLLDRCGEDGELEVDGKEDA